MGKIINKNYEKNMRQAFSSKYSDEKKARNKIRKKSSNRQHNINILNAKKRDKEDGVSDYNKLPYKRYLRTYYWKARKSALLCSRWQVCYCCGRIEKLDVHHLKYEKGKEKDKDLVLLCRNCHQNIHGITGKIDEKKLKMLSDRYKKY